MTKQNLERIIANNPHASSDYFIEKTYEAGLVLTGTEIKSLRSKAANIRDGFVEVNTYKKSFIAILQGVNIPVYDFGNIWNHSPLRKRQLLLHKKELAELYGGLVRKSMTIIPLRMYFLRGKAKILLALAKGKKKYDKREDVKKKDALREMSRVMKR